MKITTFCFCILGTMLGMWLADLGAWPSAGGIWVICLILAIDGAARHLVKNFAKPSKEDPITDQDLAARGESLRQRQRTLSTPGGLARSTVAPPPPPKRPANPFKVGDKALAFGKHEGTIIGIAGQSVKITTDDNKAVWVPSRECELICEKQP